MAMQQSVLSGKIKNLYCNYFIADVYRRVNFEGLQICPHFADFEFTNWTRNGEV